MEAWNKAWGTATGREPWLEPEAFVVEQLPAVRAAGLQRALDLGFGVGRHAILLAQNGLTVHGLEAAANGLVHANQWAASEGLTLDLQLGDMAALPYVDDFFDLILTWNVIYHGTLAELQQVIREIERSLRPGGHLLCSLLSPMHKRYGLGDEIEPNTFVIPNGGETSHPHHYSDRAEVERLLENFTIHRCEDQVQPAVRSGNGHWHIHAVLDG